MRLADDSEPEPDIAVVEPRSNLYRPAHPTAADVLLLVEISDATLRYDREVKVPLYARCEIPEVWVVELPGSQVHFYRAPANGRDTQISSVTEPAPTPLSHASGDVIDLSALLRG